MTNPSDRPSWPGGVARSAGVVVQALEIQLDWTLCELLMNPVSALWRRS
jgi:hypothetical protein